MARDPLIEKLLPGFGVEADELCQKATRCLIALESSTGTDEAFAKNLDQLQGALHTLKGSAATLSLDDLAVLAHAMEDLVATVEPGSFVFPQGLADALLAGLDELSRRLRFHLDKRESELAPVEQAVARLRDRAPADVRPTAPTPASEPRLAPAPPPAPAPAPLEPAAAPAAAAPRDEERGWRVDASTVLELAKDIERLREFRLRLDERRTLVSRAQAAASAVIPGARGVEVSGLLNDVALALSLDSEELAAHLESLEGGLKIIGTLPLGTALEPLHRTVRDVARARGKRVKLSTVGGDISLDRRLVTLLKGPLVHLVRNAVDHGIETPEERRRRGKHEEGALVVRVEQQGNIVTIEVADDGGGIDAARVREVARRQGIVSDDELVALGDVEVQQLIFRAGFSTRDVVTDTSGRGVGLNVVQSELEAAGGQVEVHSTPGQGTRFLLIVPTELGSSSLMVVRCDEERVAIPLLAVEQVSAAREQAVRVEGGAMKLEIAERVIPLLDLRALLGLARAREPEPGQPLVVVHAQGRRVAFLVDEVLGDQELVIRSLPLELRDLPSYQGAATLADGAMLLVLQAAWLVGIQRVSESSLPAARQALVVDDSLTARALHRAMLEAGGFSVHVVASAEQALRHVATTPYEIVVCDVAMAGMDGLAFAKALRASPSTAQMPLILVSGKDKGADREAALAAGADGFLSKRECASGALLGAVATAIDRRRVAR